MWRAEPKIVRRGPVPLVGMLCFALALDLVMRLVFFSLRVFAIFLSLQRYRYCANMDCPDQVGIVTSRRVEIYYLINEPIHSKLFWINTDSRERWRRDEQMKDGECIRAWVRWKLGTEPGSSGGECLSLWQGRAEAIEAIALGSSL